MERLLAWYRVGSSVGAVGALIAANLVPLVGVLWFGWNVWTVLTIYWLENGIVGLFNILKMRRATPPAGTGMVLGFVMHYGIFWVVHGIFVLSFSRFPSMGGEGPGFQSEPVTIAIVIAGLFISHAVSYRMNFIGRGEYLRTTGMQQAAAPYGRLVVLHITIIIGGMAIAITGAPSAAVIILVILKTALDLGFHLAEHRGDAVPAGDEIVSRPAS